MAPNIVNVTNSTFSDQPEVIKTIEIPSISGFEDERFDTIVSDSVIWVIQIVVFVILCGLVSLAGLVANVVNVIVFYRQGALSDSSNLCLLALAIVDIGCLLPVFCTSVSHAIILTEPVGLYLTPGDFMEVSTVWLHIMFVQMASWITAFIAFERCLCVLLPFKVKTLFSAKRSLVVMVTIAVLFTLSFIPTFASPRLEEALDPFTNETRLHFFVTDAYVEITTIADFVNAIVLRTLAMVIIFVCTQTTVYGVNQSKSWRKSIGATSTNAKSDSSKETTGNKVSSDPASQRERRLVRMITTISTIFMVCNAPDVIGVVLLYFVPSLKALSHMDNVFVVIMSLQFCLESINSSINIVVYYNMSTRYRQELRAWLGLERKPR